MFGVRPKDKSGQVFYIFSKRCPVGIKEGVKAALDVQNESLNERLLSAGGKDVLIKSVTQVVPIFSMACFRLPEGLCSHINSMLRKFWWGSKNSERKTCWVSWKEMCKPKYMGGLGFRDIGLFNLALLA